MIDTTTIYGNFTTDANTWEGNFTTDVTKVHKDLQLIHASLTAGTTTVNVLRLILNYD